MNNSTLKSLDKSFIWHPFTQMKEYCGDNNLIIDRGEGVYLYDIEGRKYIDGVSSLWVNIFGHNHPYLNKAIYEQLKKIAHSTLLGISHKSAVILAEKLLKIVPQNLKKVFYSDNGSTAVEIALKMSVQYWKQKKNAHPQKNKFLYFSGGYHGDTVGSVSVGGIDTFHKIFKPLLFKSYKAVYPYCYRCPIKKNYPDCKFACVEIAENILKKNHHKIAGCIIEPIAQGAAGIIVSPPGFLKKISSLCKKYNCLLIADEVATGFGRTGKMFACQWENVQPDILLLAKGLTGGYLPLAVTLTTQEIYNAFYRDVGRLQAFFHGHTYTGNPLGCASAIATLELFEKENLLQKIQPRIKYLEKLLEKFKEHPNVGEVRQKGFMVGIELVENKKTKKIPAYKKRSGHKIILKAREKGLIIRPLDNVLVLMPLLISNEKILKEITEITYWAIDEVIGKIYMIR